MVCSRPVGNRRGNRFCKTPNCIHREDFRGLRQFAEGVGVSEDDAEAVRWLRLAAEQGHAGAQVDLAVVSVRVFTDESHYGFKFCEIHCTEPGPFRLVIRNGFKMLSLCGRMEEIAHLSKTCAFLLTSSTEIG